MRGMDEMERRSTKGRKIIAMITAAALVTCGLTPIPGAGVEKAYAHWADSYLQRLVDQNVMRGEPDGNLYPDRNITRAEFAVMINQACGFTQKSDASFSDVYPTDWYADAIKIANYQGFMSGTSAGTASPQAALTREEAVTMLSKALKIPEETSDTMAFDDSKKFSNWSKGYINAAVKRNILSGYPDGTFRPQNPITRGEAARVLDGLAGTIVRSGGETYLGYVNGNVTLCGSGSGLRNTTITGDLYITEGVGTGYVFLDNVTVLGEIIISGGGQSNQSDNSIVLDNCEAKNIVVDLNHDKVLSLIAQGDSSIKNVVLKTPAFLAENNARGEAFQNVDVQGEKGCTANLSGSFETVRIMAEGNEVKLNKGRISKLVADENGPDGKIYLEKDTEVDELYIDSKVDVKGKGKIDYLSVGVSGGVVEQLPNEIYIRPGVTAKINGKEMGNLDAESQNRTPRVQSGYPEVNEITVNTAKSDIMGNKPGTVYWAVKEDGEATPSEEEMKDPKKDEKILKSGNIVLSDEEKAVVANVSGLTTGRTYEIYAMLVDSKGDASKIRSESFETLDKTAPKFVSGYPRAEAVYQKTSEETVTNGAIQVQGDSQISFEAVTDKDCTIYWSVLPAGSVAPTAANVANGNVPGSVGNGSASAKLNEICRFAATGLNEATKYDVYLSLKDSKGNVSAISKVTLSTKDVTAPDFIPPYIMDGAVADTSVEQKVMTTENATVYWAVYKAGTPFPPGYVGSQTGTDSDGRIIKNVEWLKAAANAIKNGNSALLKGSVTTTAEKEASFTVSGLTAQTTYNLYVLIQDAAGNVRVLGPRNLITKDNINPTAKMVFDPAYVSEEGYPQVGSDMRIAFSELVFVNKVGIAALDKSKLSELIKFYKTSVENPREEIPIDFTAVSFDETNGYTEIVFTTKGTGSGATSSALTLTNGSDYYFELNKNITDITGNNLTFTPPNQQTAQNGFMRMEQFHTMAPFINLKTIGAFGNYDIIFDVNPIVKDAAPDLLYDTVIESDRDVSFKLYKVNNSDGTVTSATTPTLVTGPGISSNGDFGLDKGQFVSLTTLILGQRPQAEEFTKFNELQRTQYILEVTALDGNRTASAWNGTLNITVRGVAGISNGMYALAISRGVTFDDFIRSKDAVDGNLAVVSDPSKLETKAYFLDSVAPVLKEPLVLSPGDTKLRMEAIADKACTFYWIIAPETSTTATPSAISMKQGLPIVDGKNGKFPITAGDIRVLGTAEGLKPQTKYKLFYMLGGTKDGEVQMAPFETTTVATPTWAQDYPRYRESTSNGANIEVKFSNTTADVYWSVYASGKVTNPDGDQISSGQTIGGAEKVSSGTITGLDMGRTGTFTCTNLEPGVYYDCFVVARNPLGTQWSTVEKLRITAQDQTAPKVEQVYTYLDGLGGGEVVVNFSKPLYYAPLGTDVTNQSAWNEFSSAFAGNATNYTAAMVNVWNVKGSPATGAVKTLTFNFSTRGPNGGTVYYNFYFGDSTPNLAGKGLRLILEMDADGKPKWTGSFDPLK